MAFDGGLIEATDGHRLWMLDWGNPEGVPAVFLHGGPGGGVSPASMGLFDAALHRVIFLDQRGAGQSTPSRGREANTTAHLVADLEQIRASLGLESWYVVGGSWGATLALAYAEAHPDRVRGLVMRSVFLGTRAELDWAFDAGLATFFPELHAGLHAVVRGAADPLTALWAAILDPDPGVHHPAAIAFYRAERAMSELRPGVAGPDPASGARLPASPFMEAHYFAHDCFLEPDQLIRDVGRLAEIPGTILQPLQDLLCPPATSARLAAAWPKAKRLVIPGAGHSVGHPEVFAALKQAVAEMLR
jgi:proline iminopeptidase